MFTHYLVTEWECGPGDFAYLTKGACVGGGAVVGKAGIVAG